MKKYYISEDTNTVLVQSKDYVSLKKEENWLKNLRQRNNLSQKDLSIITGVSIFTIQNIEQGKRKGSKETIKKLKDFFFQFHSLLSYLLLNYIFLLIVFALNVLIF